MFQSYSEIDPAYSVGLDPSLSGFGVVCRPINHEQWYGYTLKTETKDGADETRVTALAQEVIQTLNDLEHPVKVVTFEDYGPITKMAGKITARAEICGIIKYHLLHVLHVPIIMVTPNALKAFAIPERTGKGFASKEEMVNMAHNQGYYAQTEDEADAYFAAQLGDTLYRGDKAGVSFRRVNPD